MAIREAKNRYIMLLNAKRNAVGSGIWAPTENETGSISGGSGRTGQQENSIFYMGFSKNFNTILNATRYPISDKAVDGIAGDTDTTTNGGFGCCVEFKGYDSGFQGPMPSQKLSSASTYDRSWLTTIVGQSQKIGVFPVNIALHTYVDNDYVASHALAQAWLLKDANKINSGPLDALSSANYSGYRPGGSTGPSGASAAGNWNPCVYKHMWGPHIKNYPFGLYPGGLNEQRILYNSICSLRKNAYFRAYGDDKGWSTNKNTWWGSGKDFQGVNASNCMNYYDYTFEMPWWSSKRCDNRWLVTTNECQTKSYGGGYVSLHHLHFTTYGNTSNRDSNGNFIESPYKNMYFYIPTSTGESATEIPLESGSYDPSTNTTHYWVYFYDNRYTDKSVYNDNYVESGWSYDSPINIPVGKVYSKITPVAIHKSNGLPKEGNPNHNNNFFENYSCTIDRNSIGSVYYNDGSHSSPVHYIASFTTSFNIYLVCKSDQSYSSPRKAKDRVLGAGEQTTNFRFEEEKDGFTQLASLTGDNQIEIKDDIPIQEQQDEDQDTDYNLTRSITEPAGVQICSISGILVDNTWAFSHINSNFWNLEYARHMAPYIRVCHHHCVSKWGEWLDTPKMHGLLLLQHCCSDGDKRYFSTNTSDSTPPGELTHNMYCPGNQTDTSSTVYVLSSHEENSFVLNNGSKITNVSKVPNVTPIKWTRKFATDDGDGRWLKNNGNYINVYNIIKVSNNNAQLKMPTSVVECSLTTPTAHNRGLYASCTENQTGIVREVSGVPVKNFRVGDNDDSTTTSGNEITQGWPKNHYRSTTHEIADCGVDFITKNGNNFIRTYQTNKSAGTLVNKVEKDITNNSAGESEELNSPNLNFVAGRLGSIPSYARKYRAKFSIVKDSVRINGIPLNKMASKFPLEARNKDIPNIITFKLGIDFRYYYAGSEGKPKLDNQGNIIYIVRLSQGDPGYDDWKDGEWTDNHDGNGIQRVNAGTYNSEIWLNDTNFVPNIFDNSNISGQKEYGIGNEHPIIPFYSLYNDDLFIDSVGTTRDIVLPAKYSKDFPYYNISLRLPLTAIDNEFCSRIGNNKFIGANCYDVTDSTSTYEYINEEGATFDIPNNNDPSIYSYEVKIINSTFNPNTDNSINIETDNTSYVRATDEQLNDPTINVDNEGYVLDENNQRIPESIISSNGYGDDELTPPNTESVDVITENNISYTTENRTCELYGILNENCPLKGIKYEFKILKSEIVSNSREVLTCFLKFWNDSDTFGFLDFSFKFPKFCFDSNGDDEITGNEMDSYTIEGSTTLSSLLNKIIIKGVEIDNNEVLFNTASFETSLKKALNSSVTHSLPNEHSGGTEDETAIIDFVTTPEITVSDTKSDSSDATGISDNSQSDVIASKKDGVMNIGNVSQSEENEENEVLINPGYFAILNRNTGEIIGVGNDASINYDEYGRFIASYLNPSDNTETKTAGQGKGLGMKNVENMCITRNILPVLSNKIIVY